MTANMNELDDKWFDARLAILERIEKDTKENADAKQINELAEAYACLTSTQQAHG
jgi:hypothetical protein